MIRVSRWAAAAVLGCVTLAAQDEPAPIKPVTPSEQQTPSPATTKQRWFLEATPDAKAVKRGEKPFADTLQFRGDQVAFSACESKGFAPSSYQLTKGAGDTWTLTTEQASKANGTTTWSLELKENGMATGTMTLAPKPDQVIHYSVDGRRETPVEGARFELTVQAMALGEDEDQPDAERVTVAVNEGKLVVSSPFGEGFASAWVDVSDAKESQAKTAGHDAKPGYQIRVRQRDSEGTVREWQAGVVGDVIRGTVIDTRDGEVVAKHTFEGKRAAPARG